MFADCLLTASQLSKAIYGHEGVMLLLLHCSVISCHPHATTLLEFQCTGVITLLPHGEHQLLHCRTCSGSTILNSGTSTAHVHVCAGF